MAAAAGLSADEPILRTLAPALREIEAALRSWTSARHPQPLSTLQKATLGGIADDLARQAGTLQEDQPHLVVVLMGGTGVGKSTLLNALAGAPVAQASLARPTTRDPVVYVHQALSTQKLDPALRACRLATHDREALRHKILVDTPDIDSNDRANRERLFRILPTADVVLYVGSQEKYHDQVGWDLFLEQKRRRAFAFVLNKWDRCVHPGAGSRPDDDWLRDLVAAGFEAPRLFRTCAQHWAEQPGRTDRPPVEGEQFPELVAWIEQGLSRLEIEAIKAHGVAKLLGHLETAIADAMPPDLVAAAGRADAAWQASIRAEAESESGLLLAALDPYRVDIEAHFAARRRGMFSGFMAWYLGLAHAVRGFFVGGKKLSGSWLPRLPGLGSAEAAKDQFSFAAFLAKCSREASEQRLDARIKAFADRLLLDAETHGMPVTLLQDRTDAVLAQDWRTRRATAMHEVLADVERAWADPSGPRRWVQKTLVLLGNTLPTLALFGMTTLLLWQYFMERRPFASGDLALPLAVVALTVMALHAALAVLLPMRWPNLRSEFQTELTRRLASDSTAVFGPLPQALAADLLADRKRLTLVQTDVADVSRWLSIRADAAAVGDLFTQTRA